MKLLEEVSERLDNRCIRTRCAEGRCSLSLAGIERDKYVLVAMDDPNSPADQTQTRCDFLYFGESPNSNATFASPIELTSRKRKRLTRIVAQLRAGAELAETLLPDNAEVQCVPLAVGPFGPVKRREFRKESNRIWFGGRPTYAISVECGSRLADALDV